MTELSIKDRLESRVKVGDVIRFEKLIKIMKSLGHALYIEGKPGGSHIDCVKVRDYPYKVKIGYIVVKTNQIWSMGEMIPSTHVGVEEVA